MDGRRDVGVTAVVDELEESGLKGEYRNPLQAQRAGAACYFNAGGAGGNLEGNLETDLLRTLAVGDA